MSSSSEYTNRFYKKLIEFTKDLHEKYPQETRKIRKYYDDTTASPETQEAYAEEFLKMAVSYDKYFSSQNEILFSPSYQVLRGADFFHIWNHEQTTDEYRLELWTHLHTLYLYAFESKHRMSYSRYITKHLKHKQRDSDIDPSCQMLLDIVDSMNHKYEPTEQELEEERKKEQDTSGDDTFQFNFNNPEELLGGKIGELAKEIASEIDPSTLHLDNPQELLQNLMSGQLDESNDASGVVNLVKRITDKVQTKLASGSIKETDLFQEAQNTLGKLGGKQGKQMMKQFSKMMGKMAQQGQGQGQGVPMGSGVNILEQVARQMGVEPPTPEMMEHAQDMFRRLQTGQLSQADLDRMRTQTMGNSTRDRLRKRLDAKKQLPPPM